MCDISHTHLSGITSTPVRSHRNIRCEAKKHQQSSFHLERKPSKTLYAFVDSTVNKVKTLTSDLLRVCEKSLHEHISGCLFTRLSILEYSFASM